MTVVEELIVAVREEGAQETEDNLEGVESQFDDTADSVGDSADEMQGFATRFQGAMRAIMAGFAVAAAGLLANVPVVSELFSGLVSILEAVAFQMDNVLRPILTPLTNLLFDLSGAIFEAGGALGTFIGVVGTIIAILGGLAGAILTANAVLGTKLSLFGVLIGLGKIVIGAIAAVVGAVALVPVAIVAAIAALALLAWHFREPIVKAIQTALDWLSDLANRAVDWITDMADIVTDALTDLARNAYRWGRDLVNNLIDGLMSRLSALRSAASRVASAVRDRLPGSDAETGPLSDLSTTGPALVDTFAEGIEANVNRAGSAADSVAGAASPNFAAGRSESPAIFLDGNRVDENQSRFQRSRISRRGR